MSQNTQYMFHAEISGHKHTARTTHAWHAQFIFLIFFPGMAQRDMESQGNGISQDILGFSTIWCCVPSATTDPVSSAGQYIEISQIVKRFFNFLFAQSV